MMLQNQWIDLLHAGGVGSGCKGPNCGRPITAEHKVSGSVFPNPEEDALEKIGFTTKSTKRNGEYIWKHPDGWDARLGYKENGGHYARITAPQEVHDNFDKAFQEAKVAIAEKEAQEEKAKTEQEAREKKLGLSKILKKAAHKDGFVTLWHGTGAAAAESIQKQGLTPAGTGNHENVQTDTSDDEHVFLTPTKKGAIGWTRKFAEHDNSAVAIEFRVPEDFAKTMEKDNYAEDAGGEPDQLMYKGTVPAKYIVKVHKL